MIQLQALNYILTNKDVDLLNKYDKKYYFTYDKEYDYIVDHYRQYKTLPDTLTVAAKFDSFTPLDVTESRKYIEDKLYEEYVCDFAIKTINNSAKDFTKDAVKAKDELIKKLSTITPPTRSYGVDIIKNAKDRYNATIDKMAHREMYMFSTGLDELDMILNGGVRRGEELLIIYARTNNAKTWIAEKIAVEIWAGPRNEKGNPTGHGHNIGFFSPEMGPDNIGYRFDTLFKNFDNHGIMGDSAGFDSEPYRRYIDKIADPKKNLPVFDVTSPIDFDKYVTVTKLRDWVKERHLDALVIDGLQYLVNERGGNKKNTAENLTEIAEDLMILSTEMKIPVIAVHQANRTGARDSDGDVSTESPELDSLRGSDGISHNASRAISVYKDKDMVKLYLSKNRYGAKGQRLFYHYDVNFGKFTYTPNPKDGINIDTTTEADNFNDDKGTPF